MEIPFFGFEAPANNSWLTLFIVPAGSSTKVSTMKRTPLLFGRGVLQDVSKLKKLNWNVFIDILAPDKGVKQDIGQHGYH